MAVIFSYPVKSTPELTDKMLISDGTDNLTKQVTISGVKETIDVVDSITATSPLVSSLSTGAITISIPAATSGVNGYLTSTNWSTFNGKQPELQSGVNIKTINSNPILGSGDLIISGAAANPAGSAGQIQYNNDGTSFGALPFFTTNRVSKVDIAYELGLKGDGTNHGLLKLYCEAANAAHHVGIKGPNHTGGTPATYTIQLPNSLPSVANQILESNASGTLSWIATPSGGGGSSYQAGNGIDINTGTTPDTINTGLLSNGGLLFDSAKMKVNLAATAMSGELRAVDGGTGLNNYNVGDLLYAETTTTLGSLTVGANDKILGINNGATSPEWITNLVSKEVTAGHMLIGNNTSAMIAIDTTAKGTIAVGNGTTTTTLAAGTDAYVLTARSSAATGLAWEVITSPTVNLASGVTGTLPVSNGGTGLASVSASSIPRGSGSSSMVADSYLIYNNSTKSLSIRGTGNTTPTMSAPLSINDVQGSSSIYEACIGLTPYKSAQGGKAISIGLDGYRDGIIVVRKNTYSGSAMTFYQTVSGSSQIGSITMTNSATAYNTTSDYRLKENVVDMTGSVDRLKQLKPSRFNFITDGPSKTVDGFIAHEVSSVVPEAIAGIKDAVDAENNIIPQGIDQSKLVPLLVGAIKELTARIEALEA